MHFVLQGLTTNTHTAELTELFNIPAVQSSMFSIAFVNLSGLIEVEEILTANASSLVVFAGIRNAITSYQGLKRLHEIIGNRLYVVDTGSRSVMFHPKFYLVRGNIEAKLMIGSANLTLGGLNNNIEASVILNIDLSDENEKAFIDEIVAVMTALPADYPAHVTRITKVAQLDGLLESGRIIDENQLPPVTPSNLAPDANTDTIPPMPLKVKPVRSKLTKTLLGGLPKKKKKAVPAVAVAVAAVNLGADYELVWESKELTRRDLSIPDDEKVTHATGSMNLDKGRLAAEIDHRHYFRDEVFNDLTWKTSTRKDTVDDATATFELVLKGVSAGEYTLTIHHTTSTDTKMYEQRNAMTRLSWGTMHDKVGRPDLIGRTAKLYRNRSNTKKFLIEID
ncbi:MAG: phospholipase D-like domain-containing protein [Pyrinomonadaceae bacterium]